MRPQTYYPANIAVSLSGVEWYTVSKNYVAVKICGRDKAVSLKRSSLPDPETFTAFTLADAVQKEIQASTDRGIEALQFQPDKS
jgi:hypothetical protein